MPSVSMIDLGDTEGEDCYVDVDAPFSRSVEDWTGDGGLHRPMESTPKGGLQVVGSDTVIVVDEPYDDAVLQFSSIPMFEDLQFGGLSEEVLDESTPSEEPQELPDFDRPGDSLDDNDVEFLLEVPKPRAEPVKPTFEDSKEAAERLVRELNERFYVMPPVKAADLEDQYCMLCCAVLDEKSQKYHGNKVCQRCYDRTEYIFTSKTYKTRLEVGPIVYGTFRLLDELEAVHKAIARDGLPQLLPLHRAPIVKNNGEVVEGLLDDYFSRPGNTFNAPDSCGRCGVAEKAPNGLCLECKDRRVPSQEDSCVFCPKKLNGRCRVYFGEMICLKCVSYFPNLLAPIKPREMISPVPVLRRKRVLTGRPRGRKPKQSEPQSQPLPRRSSLERRCQAEKRAERKRKREEKNDVTKE